MAGEAGARHYFQTGIWPLCSDGERVDMLVVIEDFAGLVAADLELR